MSARTFVVNDAYDRDMASDGCSRYGAYLRERCAMFYDDDEPETDSVRFALAAWRVAQPPIMWPGYVRSHPRVVGQREHWDDDGRPAVAVELAIGMSSSISRSIASNSWRDWCRDSVGERWVEPYDNDQASSVGRSM